MKIFRFLYSDTSLLLPSVKKQILVSVSNDLTRDQRVKKQCAELTNAGYEIVLVGRELPDSVPLIRSYKTVRFKLWVNKGALFYACLNIRLFWFLMWQKNSILWANDLDTLAANYIVAKLKGVPLVYDSHEYFTEVPEIQGKPIVKGIWTFIEKSAIGRCNMVLTVSPSIVSKIEEKYNLSGVLLVRNVPNYMPEIDPVSRDKIGVTNGVNLLIMQGNGINMDRGGEELVAAMALIPDSVLMIIGKGDSFPSLRELAQKTGVENKVLFINSLPYEELLRYTAAADIGLSLDKGSNLNYQYSLPNKIFDYALGGTAVMASDLREVGKVVRRYELGALCKDVTPEAIAKTVNEMLADKVSLQQFGSNGRKMVVEVNWEREFKPVLKSMESFA